ncbi:bifunctional glycosyltransferase/CDP-glycerol:glycerophosphate glycerophosphotransferase [Actinomadura rudentiformis]|uniref:bifunctional glycosyltransferase/CDP-glycerol:glycerophosphate glycerophosphotransferase n=1 Tax=Actinomadura rudentiformis TaxID=359158 RepID=UPI00178C2964|nr:bifunctional glycosyltransferase family 2 protein/CDP-glycerol:glycerophosphate glycerophosphotransferase [Actinomadura rudentiformis]
MPNLISVVVLARRSGTDLAETLASLAAQTHRTLEVLVVDGGTGAGADVTLPDERFRLIREGAPGRGAARNIGVREATGEFLAFAEDGDVLPEHALATLHAALTAGDSDFAAGNVGIRREGGAGTRLSPVHKKAFATDLAGTHIRRHEALLDDRLVGNKLFRASFWERSGLAFPDVNRDDDLAVAVPAYYLADAVDVVSEVVVRRFADVAPAPSAVPQDAADGFAAVEAALAALDGRWKPKERRRFLAAVLDRELRAFLEGLPDTTDEERDQVVAQAAAHADWLDPKALAALPAITRLKWHLAAQKKRGELVKVVRYGRGKPNPSIVREGMRRYVVHPYWKDDKLGVPQETYRARSEVALRGRVHEVSWRDGKLVVTGEAYINSVSSRRKWTAIKGVSLRSGRKRIPLLARQTPKPGKKSGAWTGFEFTLDPKRLKRRGGWRDGVWDVEATVFNAGVLRSARLRGGTGGSGARPPYHYVTDDVRIVPKVVDGALRIAVETVTTKATGLRWAGDGVELDGVTTGAVPAELSLALGDEVVRVPVTAGDSDQFSGRFSARLPLPSASGGTDPHAIDDTRDWAVLVDGQPLVLAEGVADLERLIGSQEVFAGRGPSGYLRLQLRTARLLVTAADWSDDGTLVLTGSHAAYDAGEIVIRSRGRRKDYPFTVKASGDGTLVCHIPAAAMPSVAGVLPLRQGRWDVLFRPTGGRPLAVRTTPEISVGPQPSVEIALRAYSLESQGNNLVVHVTSNLTAEERGAGATAMRAEARKRVAKDGLRDAVLFSCFNGRQYSDSPRAIHEELVRRGVDMEQLWVVNDGQVELPDTLQAVRLNGREWHEAVASSRYIITNHRLGDWFQRHPDQVVLQTWHGTPLKKIGRDLKEVHFAYAPGMKKALQAQTQAKSADVPATPNLPEWTHLLSPNPFSTEIFRRAFGFKGEIIEAGYPRNDVLYHPESDRIAASVRAKLGIPEDKKVVLYAPTWRDDQYYSRGRYKFDMRLNLAQAQAALGDDHVLLVRLHSNVVDGVPEDGNGFVFDVSLYPDIAELYLISDMMITDYSSVMFDFANTRRPMLFFTYDLADYRDRLRGFYFDFEKEAPGPLLETSDALIGAIRNVDEAAADHELRYKNFVDRFCPLDDGHAAARVIEKVFPGLSG